MTILRHELHQGFWTWLVWTAVIAGFLAVCVAVFPQMGEEVAQMGDMFANMGAFSAAFGMDQLNFGTFDGYFAVECGNVLGLGGGLFAAMLGISMLSKEEQEGTAEFLLSHPIFRSRVVAEKLGALVIQIVALNLVTGAVTAAGVALIDVEAHWKTLGLMLLAYLLLQLELGAVTFGLSACLRENRVGLGLGLAVGAYFLNLVGNMVEDTRWLRWITPYAYCDGADIVSREALDGGYLVVGAGLAALGVLLAFRRYGTKDIG